MSFLIIVLETEMIFSLFTSNFTQKNSDLKYVKVNIVNFLRNVETLLLSGCLLFRRRFVLKMSFGEM